MAVFHPARSRAQAANVNRITLLTFKRSFENICIQNTISVAPAISLVNDTLTAYVVGARISTENVRVPSG